MRPWWPPSFHHFSLPKFVLRWLDVSHVDSAEYLPCTYCAVSLFFFADHYDTESTLLKSVTLYFLSTCHMGASSGIRYRKASSNVASSTEILFNRLASVLLLL